MEGFQLAAKACLNLGFQNSRLRGSGPFTFSYRKIIFLLCQLILDDKEIWVKFNFLET
jgi:hypothetical protein